MENEMIERTVGLDLADELYRKGIMPRNFNVLSIDYSKVKQEIKDQIGITIKVTAIKTIFNRLNDEIIAALIKDQNIGTIGSRIRELRIEKGFSQEAFAFEINLDRTYMGGIERGERNIAAINIIKIAKGLEVEVGELFPPIRNLKID